MSLTKSFIIFKGLLAQVTLRPPLEGLCGERPWLVLDRVSDESGQGSCPSCLADSVLVQDSGPECRPSKLGDCEFRIWAKASTANVCWRW